MGHITTMSNKIKTKSMTAFRFAKFHNIPVKYYKDYRFDSVFDALSHRNLLDILTNSAAIMYHVGYNITVIATTKHTSQLIKEISIWHELGHWSDRKQIGTKIYDSQMSILKKEARASMIAIRFMKKYSRYKPMAKEDLLKSYDGYASHYPYKHSYRHLIEEA